MAKTCLEIAQAVLLVVCPEQKRSQCLVGVTVCAGEWGSRVLLRGEY